MWRIVSMLFVVLMAIYNIGWYTDVFKSNNNHHNQVADHVSSLQEPNKALETDINTTFITGAAKFFLIPTPEITSNLLLQQNASAYYESHLNEDSAEVWLHQGFERMAVHRTLKQEEADVFLIAAYLHLARWNNNTKDYVKSTLLKRIHNKTKPHVVLCPTWNPETSRMSGIAYLIQQLLDEGIKVYSVGFERNPSWQVLSPDRIIPIPYVVRPSLPRTELRQQARFHKRQDNFVFYAGDGRKHAVEWAGCNRSMIVPLQNEPNMNVSIRNSHNRLSQQEYNRHMFNSDYCLILCGDTVTSRSLTSAMVYGCIPVQVGSRWHGLCEVPCHKGWGWTVTGANYPHLPFSSEIQWQEYPQVNEQEFSDAPLATLQHMFDTITLEKKTKLRNDMLRHQLGWIYGWGDPVTSNEFGQATEYVWNSIVVTLGLQ